MKLKHVPTIRQSLSELTDTIYDYIEQFSHSRRDIMRENSLSANRQNLSALTNTTYVNVAQFSKARSAIRKTSLFSTQASFFVQASSYEEMEIKNARKRSSSSIDSTNPERGSLAKKR